MPTTLELLRPLQPSQPLQALLAALAPFDAIAVAVSGGIDSLTLATAAARHHPGRVTMFHALSAAVPQEATARTRALAAAEGWTLRVVNAGELEREDYLANPVNRCLHCKRALYDTVTTLTRHTRAQIVSGANTDDLGDYRPGLQAAAEAGVRHPYIDAGIGKAGIRALARELGLGALAELPASPCLSSRVETGIRIHMPTLRRIDLVEQRLREFMPGADLRCRVRRTGVVVELDAATFAGLDDAQRRDITEAVHESFGDHVAPMLEPYRQGSAFVGVKAGRPELPA